MFEGGKLIGTFISQAKDGETVALEPRGQSPEGRYVVLQKNNQGLNEDEQQLHINDVVAFGKYNGQMFSECEGLQQPKVITSSSPHSRFPIKEIFTDGGNYWLAANMHTGPGFTLKLSACTLGVAGVLIKNAKFKASTSQRATRGFSVSGSLMEDGPWKLLLEEEFDDPFADKAPTPVVQTFYLEEVAKVKYLRFDLKSYWKAYGGGLDFFGVITESGSDHFLLLSAVFFEQICVNPSYLSAAPMTAAVLAQ